MTLAVWLALLPLRLLAALGLRRSPRAASSRKGANASQAARVIGTTAAPRHPG